jgi:hypothetical protein
MAWTQPKTWSSEPLTSSDLNTHLRDNLEILKDPASGDYTLNEVSDYTTTSTTFVDVDATNLSATLTTNGGDVFVFFAPLVALGSSQIVFFDLDVDGTRLGGNDGIVATVPTGVGVAVPIIAMVTGLTAGSHTIKLQWKVSAGTGKIYAGAGTANADVHPQFIVREVS